MDDTMSHGEKGERRGIRPLTLAVALLIATQLAWGAASCLGAAAAPQEPAAPPAAAVR